MSMMVSTKGRYALRVMIDLAENEAEGYIAMKKVAERQDISLKYLEKILPDLVKSGLVEGISGKGGGYRLSKAPSEITVCEILKVTENGVAPVACLEEGAPACERCSECRTIPMWTELNRVVDDYLSSVSLESLMKKD